MQTAKSIEIVAGPNGSGKTTFAESYFLRTKRSAVFLNPDLIAAGISPLGSNKASFKAGRVLISEIKSRITEGSSFSFETTMSGKTWLPVLRQAKTNGYDIVIYFVFLTSIEQCLARIDRRVKMGGHDIPVDAVHRRYQRCFANFWHDYRALANHWYLFDNSNDDPSLVMKSEDFGRLSKEEQDLFAKRFLEGQAK